MILKIDHISFSCDEKTNCSNSIPKEYELFFSEIRLPNVDCKKELLLNRENKTHDIFMFQSDWGNIPIEVTQYRVTTGQSEISFNKSDIYIPTCDIQESARFFMCLGMKIIEESVASIVLELSTFLDKEPFRIHLSRSPKPRKPYLDILGFSSIGFFVDCIETEAKKLCNEGYAFTGISPIKVNGKTMKVAFSYGKAGEIVELIALGGKNENY